MFNARLCALGLTLWALSPTVTAKSAACTGTFINPITDICWHCLFPLTLGKVPLVTSKLPDTANPSMPLSFCPKPPPVFMQVGLNIGYWEPYALTDVTRVPYCMVNMGLQMGTAKSQQIGGQATAKKQGDASNGAFYQVHWYKYPLIYWLQILQSAACMATDNFDVAYLSELDPFWDDDELAFVLNPEAVLFGNPVAQLPCIVESVKTSTGKSLPMDALFWCLGSQGSAYPLTGTTGYRDTPMQAAVLMTERMNYKLHRQGIVWESTGKDGAICYQHPMPILPKSRYRYQLTRVKGKADTAYPYGTTTALWESGYDNPVKGDNFGFMNFRKRNCVFL
ncbi:conjugal transfer pilus assembly protein TraU [Photobacterium leiognathi]|uniref:conjugal transfer pilus assembly protein TraU n=1 Tax=Photobacterium leiognathi TaxID=553611 RepID=UPI002738DE6A|nr:conjugal transfer pilus assembly protein TraU [Photobacterium leiognathi]